jgi:hypothetical protein
MPFKSKERRKEIRTIGFEYLSPQQVRQTPHCAGMRENS